MLKHTLIAVALFAGACGKSDDTRKNAENAAENVRDKMDDLQDNASDLKDTAKDNADELAEKTRDNAADLKEDIKDVAEKIEDRANDTSDKAKDNVDDLKNPTKDMRKDAIALRDANKEFEYQRLVRVETLRAVHAITASQPNLVNALASSMPLVEADRAKLNEKLQLLQMRLDESANVIQSLTAVDAAHWDEKERGVSDAMKRLDDAREDAWDALDDAKTIDRTSMR